MFKQLELIQNTSTRDEAEVLTRAFYFAKEAHTGQKRASGEEYFIHPCAVAQILIDLGMDAATAHTPSTQYQIRPSRGDAMAFRIGT